MSRVMAGLALVVTIRPRPPGFPSPAPAVGIASLERCEWTLPCQVRADPACSELAADKSSPVARGPGGAVGWHRSGHDGAADNQHSTAVRRDTSGISPNALD